ncbi:MAG: transglutaminase-like domain-containing protein [Actinomycetota bacterium]
MRNVLERLRPTNDDVVDLAFSIALVSLAVVGFSSTFSGGEEIWTGIPAVLVGVATGYVIYKARWSPLVGFLVVVVVFFIAGAPLAVGESATAGVIPNLDTTRELVDGLTGGWIRLLTSLPPAGGAGNLLTIPFVCGYGGGVITILLARLVTRPVCAIMPVVVLCIAVLMGTDVPASIVLQGVVFSAVTLGWVVVRGARTSAAVPHRLRTSWALSIVVMLVVVALAGSWLGPRLPGAEAEERFVLRTDVVPPFDPLLEPSPLAGFRRYTGTENEDAVVLNVTGLEPGVRLRLATMDLYDELVWKSSGDGSALGGTFVRVGTEIPDPIDGTPVSAEIEVVTPHGVWLPMIGDVTGIEFLDDNDNAVEWLRFNLATESAVIATGVSAGDRYQVSGVVAPATDPVELARLGLDARFRPPDPERIPAPIRALAAELAGSATTPYGQLSAMAEALRSEGAYSDGGEAAIVPTPPGHSIARLARFLEAQEWVGNGEQYAAALAVLANARGIPVRVVMGFESGDDDEQAIRGSDAVAWVEVPLAGVGWVPVDPTPPRTNLPNPEPEPRPRVVNPEPQPPPPTVPPPAAEAPEALTVEDPAPQEIADDEEPADTSGGFDVPLLAVAIGLPLLFIVLPALVIIAWKTLRRSRRRSQGPAATRVSGAWTEVIDDGRDFGRDPELMLTRPEASAVLRVPAAAELGQRADSLVFGAEEPSDEDAAEVWELADDARRELRSQHGWFARVRARVSRASLRRQKRPT